MGSSTLFVSSGFRGLSKGFVDIDLHIHTKYSLDSTLKPKHVIKYALKAGLSAIAITDHNTTKGRLAALCLKSQIRDLMIVPGIEVSTEKGDLLVLFTESEIRSRNFLEVVDETKQEGGLIILPHPYRGHSSVKELVGIVDVVEAFNGRRPREENERALELATQFEKPVASFSDAHFFFEIGGVKTRLYAEVDSLEELRKKMLTSTRKLIFARSKYIQYGTHCLSSAVQLLKSQL